MELELRQQVNRQQAEIAGLKVRVSQLVTTIEQLRGERQPAPVHARDIRWAITAENDGSYPEQEANTLPVRFIDAEFAAAAGQQAFTKANRTTDSQPVTFAHVGPGIGNIIPAGVPVPVFQQRGLGAAGAGIWWIVSCPDWYPVRLLEDLHRNYAAQAIVRLFDTGSVLVDTPIQITVWDAEQLLEGEFLEAGSTGTADWLVDEDGLGGRFVLRSASCGPQYNEQD